MKDGRLPDSERLATWAEIAGECRELNARDGAASA
jgi:hypothetical protein